MKKQTFLYVLLILLVISNGFFLVHYLGKPSRKGHKPESFIAKKLNFDENQMKDFKDISDVHREKVKTISKEIKTHKGAMFSKLSDETISPSYLDSITSLIAVKEKEKDLETFRHLQKVRSICNEEQKQRFTKIVSDAMKRHSRRGRPNKDKK